MLAIPTSVTLCADAQCSPAPSFRQSVFDSFVTRYILYIAGHPSFDEQKFESFRVCTVVYKQGTRLLVLIYLRSFSLRAEKQLTQLGNMVTSAYKITQLKVPLYADPRRAAELSCHFIMDDYELHSVKLYRDLDEIFRYNPSQKMSLK
ncbi:unnamed protein product [Leptidea sinapis]|uniref:Uncharacterized protein n=1 Tax=Leptidea sinapis TaxID=189913 RepID=A0A5E4QW37_9NEOP|nr:unnamed protein product [Leptidea sinapis]